MRIKTLSEVKFDENTTVAEGETIDVKDDKAAKSLIDAGAAVAVDAEETQPSDEPNDDDLNV